MSGYAISTVHIGGHRADGSSVPTIQSAICNVCEAWATELRMSGRSRRGSNGDDVTDIRKSRQELTIVYSCDAHTKKVEDILVDEFGWCSNRWDGDDLAAAVEKASRLAWKARRDAEVSP